MSDPQLATRAPESDAMEDESLDTPITTKAPATAINTAPINPLEPSQPQMGDHCTTDRPLLPGQQPSGTITKYQEIETYISKPADYPTTPARLLLLLTNGRGVHSPNNQLQADSYAQQGYVVVMPDLFSGDPAPNTATETTPKTDSASSWLDTIRARVVETSKSFLIDMWLARHTPEKVLPILDTVLGQAKEEFADAVGYGGGVYAVGYCFGGKYVLVLAGERSDSVMRGQEYKEEDVEAGMVKRGPEIKCGAVAHGTLVTREDFVGIKVPVSLVCVENDSLFPEDVLEYGKKEMATSKVNHEVKVYSGVPHGFAVLGEYDSITIKEAQTAASAQMLDWLQKH